MMIRLSSSLGMPRRCACGGSSLVKAIVFEVLEPMVDLTLVEVVEEAFQSKSSPFLCAGMLAGTRRRGVSDELRIVDNGVSVYT